MRAWIKNLEVLRYGNLPQRKLKIMEKYWNSGCSGPFGTLFGPIEVYECRGLGIRDSHGPRANSRRVGNSHLCDNRDYDNRELPRL